MKILVSNDDGYQSPGLVTLADTLQQAGDVHVVAPDRDRSGASNSLTLDSPVRAGRQPNGYYSVNGTPTDCVHLAITGLLEEEPDIVIAGINLGANLGDDVLYSGTVAAATEGRFLGFPSMAVSINSFTPSHLQTAAHVVLQLINSLVDGSHTSEAVMLNVNVPDLPLEEIRGIRATRLGHRHKAEPVVKTTDPRGKPIYWVGPPGPEQDAGEGTDFHALRNGYVSVTPLQVDLTHHGALKTTGDWISEVSL
ncbi:5'/3'-nucleotidase SurE [Solemya elarraichensis gill symbiont]|uniref:5'-nucleotidase SurE n=1 Tax=Solemya elarraichensis gill symbiont TaxID=1918949 RepID=A0A1T2L5J5_9GAMM|nr:5'/3'-nucleotidase SurE [Solemya elarraichensis gill symbiont]OOZ40359.1 5'/3'-nucleotidase SurE [Solemya elarraichensis gill symbiont]